MASFLWVFDKANNVWLPVPAAVKTVRVVDLGQAVLGACKLYWVGCSPDSPAAEWVLTDDEAIDGDIVYDHFDSDKHSEQLLFSPPMQFTRGIWVEKFDHMHSLVFGYV